MRVPGPISRRGLLRAGALSTASALLTAGRARAAASPADRRFIFVVNYGGWDPLFAFAPLFGYEHVEMETEAALATAGNIAYVDHPDRPSVRAYFEGYHDRTLVLNGLLVPSVAHPPGQRAVLTGTTYEGPFGDWSTLLAVPRADAFILPAVILSGPSYPGAHSDVVCRAGSHGQLDRLLSGAWSGALDTPVAAPSLGAQGAVEAWLSARGARVQAAATSPQGAAITSAWNGSLARAARLGADRDLVVWGETALWLDQVDRAVEILAAGLARCITISYADYPWDTHSANDYYQSPNFEHLFAGLGRLMAGLDATPGQVGATLADETVIVVLSEMGRTPLHNGAGGRDHWPYTSAMLIGAGIAGDRVIGALDENYAGAPIDLASGDVDAGGEVVIPPTLGATLLALGDVDPGEALPGVGILAGVMA